MIYSGTSHDFCEFLIRIRIQMRIQIQPKGIKKKNLPTVGICHFLFHTNVTMSYSSHSPEFTGLKLEITGKCLTVGINLFFHFLLDLDPAKSSGSGSTTLVEGNAY